MKIVHVNMGLSQSSVPYRLHIAMKKAGLESKLLTMQSNLKAPDIYRVKQSLGYKIMRKLDALLLKQEFDKYYQPKEGYPFSYYRIGIDISKHPVIKKADVIVLHWICGTFLSVKSIEKLLALKKQIIIVCHDNWFFTGGCHVRMGCNRYQTGCGSCPQLQSSRANDCTSRLLEQKIALFKDRDNVMVFSPSRWMHDNIAKSMVLGKLPNYIVPNPIDIFAYKMPIDKSILKSNNGIDRDKIVLAFGAVQGTTTPYKGYRELLEALKLLKDKDRERFAQCELVVFGAESGAAEAQSLGIPIHYMGYLKENKMIELYQMSDIYLVPSLEDSFNNTVAESMACGTPVVSFATGGIVDIINHKQNGYLAKYGDVEDFERGIEWMLHNLDDKEIRLYGREKIIKLCAAEAIVELYLQNLS